MIKKEIIEKGNKALLEIWKKGIRPVTLLYHYALTMACYTDALKTIDKVAYHRNTLYIYYLRFFKGNYSRRKLVSIWRKLYQQHFEDDFYQRVERTYKYLGLNKYANLSSEQHKAFIDLWINRYKKAYIFHDWAKYLRRKYRTLKASSKAGGIGERQMLRYLKTPKGSRFVSDTEYKAWFKHL